MSDLELLVFETAQNSEEVHEDFRLFLTSMPASYFPVSILQNGIKLTTEPPRGIRANLKRSVYELTDEYLDSCNKGKEIFHRMVIGLCYFHAIVQERRKFGPLGWNIRYDFNDSDLETSKTVLLMLLNEQEQIPWDALNFVTGHINYGGRVTDDWDRRCLLSILKKFYILDILENKFQFSDSQKYIIPALGDASSYKDYVDSLPINDDTDVFGLHENANITFQAQESQKMLETILSIQPRVSGGEASKSPDEIVKELSQTILSEMPEILSTEKGNKDLFGLEGELDPPLTTVLMQEINKFNNLLIKMNSTLVSLIKAIQGIVIMSQDLDSMYNSLMNNQVPKIWKVVAYESLKPLASWIRDLKQRVKFMDDWLVNGNPVAFWMSGFYYPQGFLTGVLQSHARRDAIPINDLSFSFRFLEIDKEGIFSKPNDGVYIYGLYLEGAAWNRKNKCLANQHTGEMYQSMPVIYFIPIKNNEQRITDYCCPVYKTSVRAGVLSTTGESTNYILAIDLPTSDDNPDFWTLRGTALLTQLND